MDNFDPVRRFGLFLYIALFIVPQNSQAQRVGVVFSGGGATGFAHIGVLMALEEHDIPIDYITGTSAGALVGGLYASGYSPWEIRDIVLDEKFALMSTGELEERYKYFIQQHEDDAELMSLRFSKDSIFQKSLPTNILNPTSLDFEMMNMLALNPPSTLNTFDSLYIPFRCVASDIVTKQSVMFGSGSLSQAVRASMTYPFFISPIEIDGRLLFDGGLYNNFPASVMYDQFDPDFIIGSNVSYNEPPPVEDDLMSQIKNMFSQHSDYTLPCEAGIIIEPDLGDEVGTFEFDKIKRAIEIGYEATIAKIDSIKMFVQVRVSKEERIKSRAVYRSRVSEMNINDIDIIGVDADEQEYIEKKLIRPRERGIENLDYSTIKRRYLRLYQSEHINRLYPLLEFTSDSTQRMVLTVKKEKPWRVAFGGHYSSKPVNTGFLSVSYSDFKLSPITVYGNAYFGKFYGSVRAGLRLYLPTRSTSFIEPMFVMNRWDYFKSFSTFFEDVKPSYIIQNESYWSLRLHVPTSSKSKLLFDFSNGITEDEYYQDDNFTNIDTADYTSFLYYSPGFEYVRNNLNRKQFASAGSYLSIKSRFVHGIENTIPGSTSPFALPTKTFWNWGFLKITYKNYFMRKGVYRLGIMAEGLYSIQPFFQNYTASMISAHSFQPIPDSRTGFYNDFRANKYLAGGIMNIFSIKDKVDIRLEAYIFQPVYRILNKYGVAAEGALFYSRFGIASASVVYHSPVGPLRATVNYFDSETQLQPLSFQVSFGYVLFNPRGIK